VIRTQPHGESRTQTVRSVRCVSWAVSAAAHCAAMSVTVGNTEFQLAPTQRACSRWEVVETPKTTLRFRLAPTQRACSRWEVVETPITPQASSKWGGTVDRLTMGCQLFPRRLTCLWAYGVVESFVAEATLHRMSQHMAWGSFARCACSH
jgi:hypothetical protein